MKLVQLLRSAACSLVAMICLPPAIAQTSAASETLQSTLQWRALPDLPDELGVAGPFVGVHNDALAAALEQADLVWMFRPEDMSDAFETALAPLGGRLRIFDDYDKLVSDMSSKMLSGDQVIFMSNGGFGSARQTLTAVLQRTRAG